MNDLDDHEAHDIGHLAALWQIIPKPDGGREFHCLDADPNRLPAGMDGRTDILQFIANALDEGAYLALFYPRAPEETNDTDTGTPYDLGLGGGDGPV